jgi:hypothetical protein
MGNVVTDVTSFYPQGGGESGKRKLDPATPAFAKASAVALCAMADESARQAAPPYLLGEKLLCPFCAFSRR